MKQETEITSIYPLQYPTLQHSDLCRMDWPFFLLIFLVILTKSIHSPPTFSHGMELPAIDHTGPILAEGDKTHLHWR